MSASNDTTNIPKKTCSKCGVEYPATTEYFYPHIRHSDGLTTRCRECERKLHKLSRDNNPERTAAVGRRGYERNRDKKKQRQKFYDDQHREEKRLRDALWRKQNPDKILHYNHSARGVVSARKKAHVRRARNNATPTAFSTHDLAFCYEFWQWYLPLLRKTYSRFIRRD